MVDNTRILPMHNLNLGNSHRINYPRCTNPWGAILSSGLVRIYMLTTPMLYTKYEIQVLTVVVWAVTVRCIKVTI